MADSLATPLAGTSAASSSFRLPAGLANVWDNLREHPLAQKAALPALFSVAVLLLLFAWLFLAPPERTPLYSELGEADKAAVVDALEKARFNVALDPRSGAVLLPPADHARARMTLAGSGLPKAAPGGADFIGSLPLGTSRAVEGARLKIAQERELASSIEALDGVRGARVIIAQPDPSPFVRDRAPVTASVTVELAPGRSLSDAQTKAIIHLVAGAVPGLSPDDVAIADQTGRLLSGEGESSRDRADDRRLRNQSRMEAKLRESIMQLLVPLVGAGNVSAQVSVDLDHSAREAAHEQYNPEGALRSEAVSRRESSEPRAIGIPGAISNTIPAAANVTAEPPSETLTGPTEQKVVSEDATRNYELGRSIEVSRQSGYNMRRLTAAVAIKADALGPAEGQAKLLAEIQALVEGAVGFDQQRGDRITVIARTFAPLETAETPLWENPMIVDSSKWVAAALIFLALIFFVVRPLLKRIPQAQTSTGLVVEEQERPSVLDGGTLNADDDEAGYDAEISTLAEIDYTRKLAEVRRLASSDTARATAVARRLLADVETEDEI